MSHSDPVSCLFPIVIRASVHVWIVPLPLLFVTCVRLPPSRCVAVWVVAAGRNGRRARPPSQTEQRGAVQRGSAEQSSSVHISVCAWDEEG